MDAQSDVDEETENQRAELGGHQHLNARGILVRTRCRHRHTVCLALSDHSCQTDDTNLILRITNRPDRITLADGREWKCMHDMCKSQSNSWLLCSHFIIASVSALMVSAVQIQMMDRLNEGWSLHTMHICTICA